MDMLSKIDTTCNTEETLMERSYRFGEEDALEGEDMRGSVYFTGAALDAYFLGYAAGLDARKGLVVVDKADELEFLDQVLVGLRNGSRPMAEVYSRDALEAFEQEAIGYEVQRYPWMY